MASQSVSLEMVGNVGVLTMTHAPHNLLGPALIDGILAGLAQAEAAGARAILLKSGLRHFSAGADPVVFQEAMSGPGGMTLSPVEFLHNLESFPLPVVASVHGVCVGGGF